MENDSITRREFLKASGLAVALTILPSGDVSASTVEEPHLNCEACGKKLTDKVVISVYGEASRKSDFTYTRDPFKTNVDLSEIHYSCPGVGGIGGDCMKKVDYNNYPQRIKSEGLVWLTGGSGASLVEVKEFLESRKE